MLTAKTLFYRLGRDRESFWTATLAPPHQPQNPKLHQTSVKWIQFQTENVGSAAWSGIEFSLSWVSVHVQGGFSVNIWSEKIHDQMNIWNCKKINLEILMTVHFVLLQRGKNGNRGCHPFEPALYISTIILWGIQTTHPAWYNLWFKKSFLLSLFITTSAKLHLSVK